jgi:hypothetical protein
MLLAICVTMLYDVGVLAFKKLQVLVYAVFTCRSILHGACVV